MKKHDLVAEIRHKQSVLCVGLDTDIEKLPQHMPRTIDSVIAFNSAIIEATQEFAVSYKLNIAFYESLGKAGWEIIEETLKCIPQNQFVIADAKRGDIGNTSAMYAKTFFRTYDFDSITVAPYMGEDSLSPFYGYDSKWVIILGLTSNSGSSNFQKLPLTSGKLLYEEVLQQSSQWGSAENTMYVIGATHPEDFKHIRTLLQHHFFLVPGVGAQGGDLDGVMQNGMNADVGLLINSSRGILYASSGEDYAEKARQEAHNLQNQMRNYL